MFLEELTSHCEKRKTAATHKCHLCDQSSLQKINLTRHLRRHSGERPVKYSVFDESFKWGKSLNVHFAKYTGERLFHSNTCDKCFTQKGTLTKDSRTPNNHSILYSTKL